MGRPRGLSRADVRSGRAAIGHGLRRDARRVCSAIRRTSPCSSSPCCARSSRTRARPRYQAAGRSADAIAIPPTAPRSARADHPWCRYDLRGPAWRPSCRSAPCRAHAGRSRDRASRRAGSPFVIHLPQDSDRRERRFERTIVGRMDHDGNHHVAPSRCGSTGITQAKAREAFVFQRDSAAHQIRTRRRRATRFPGSDRRQSHRVRWTRPSVPARVQLHRAQRPDADERSHDAVHLPFGDFSRYVAAADWLLRSTRRAACRSTLPRSEAIRSSRSTCGSRFPADGKRSCRRDVNAVSPFGTVVRTLCAGRRGPAFHAAGRGRARHRAARAHERGHCLAAESRRSIAPSTL